MKGRIRLMLVPIIWWIAPECLARTPSAAVVEIASGTANAPLAACDGVHVRSGELIVTERLRDWLAQRTRGEKDWHAPSGLRRLEDVQSVVLLRSPESCVVVVSDSTRGLFPPEWRRRAHTGLRAWSVDGDRFCVDGRVAACIGLRDRKVMPVPFAGRSPPRLYYHGRLEIFAGWRPPCAREVAPDDSVSLHLEGPGDEARFLFRAKQAGSLILERTPGSMPNVDMLIGAEDGQMLIPRGMMSLAAGGEALVVFRYRGLEPLDLDVGFLFTPDRPLVCWMEVVPEARGNYRVAVTMRNRSDAPVTLFPPSSETVDWYAGDRLVAAARAARIPDTVMLGAGEIVHYETLLQVPDSLVPTAAWVNTGSSSEKYFCTAGHVK